jgi:hypothetical protein
MARNKKAGHHPSYDKRGMTEEQIRNKRKRDKKINERPEQVKKRTECNKKRSKLKSKGVDVRGKDVSHTSQGLKLKSVKANRGNKTDSKGDKKARGGKKR